jgi:hypothetical protein
MVNLTKHTVSHLPLKMRFLTNFICGGAKKQIFSFFLGTKNDFPHLFLSDTKICGNWEHFEYSLLF